MTSEKGPVRLYLDYWLIMRNFLPLLKVNRNKIAVAWVGLFVFVNLLFKLDGGTNAKSRFATLCAMVEDHTFQIDNYYHLTIDWSRTPSGHYYSNKAPGPMLVAYPLFWLFDKTVTRGIKDRKERDEVRIKYSHISEKVMSLILQVIPVSILALIALSEIRKQGISFQAEQLAAVTLLFGNTASLLMNTFFGHAFASVFVLMVCVGLLKERYMLVGFAYGFALLSDYACAFLLPALLAAIAVTYSRNTLGSKAIRFMLGGIVPGILWLIYHISCFGSAFDIPPKYQNPAWPDYYHYQMWGMINYLPKPSVVLELLLGSSRGLIWTQGWVLLTAYTCYVILLRYVREGRTVSKSIKMMSLFLVPSLVLILSMNAAYNGWHGGYCPGPRYLSSIFPSYSLLLGLTYDDTKIGIRLSLVAAIVLSVILFIAVFSTSILIPPEYSLWGFLEQKIITEEPGKHIVRAIVLVILFEFVYLWSLKKHETEQNVK